MLRRVLFVSQKRAEAMPGHARRALISITDAERLPALVRDRWCAVLRLAFDDVDPITFPGADPDKKPFTEAQAASIARFVLELPDAVGTLVVHCRAGISRSAGVARAVASCLSLPFPADYHEYNAHVCRLVIRQILDQRRSR